MKYKFLFFLLFISFSLFSIDVENLKTLSKPQLTQFNNSCFIKEDAHICFHLAKIYQEDKLIAQDYTKVINYLELACKYGLDKGCNNLGNLYYHGLDTIQIDYKKAINYYKKSCANDEPKSCYRLGMIYQKGSVVTQNIKQAQIYFNIACDNALQKACDFYQ